MTVLPEAAPPPDENLPTRESVVLEPEVGVARPNGQRIFVYLNEPAVSNWKCLASQVLAQWAPTLRLGFLLIVVITAGLVWMTVLLRHGASDLQVTGAGLLMLLASGIVAATMGRKIDTRRL